MSQADEMSSLERATIKILFLGDIVGSPGRAIVRRAVPLLVAYHGVDLVIANAENAAGGSGLDSRCHRQLADAGIHAFTMGDHLYKRREIVSLFAQGLPICKPANYPDEAPGPDHLLVTTSSGHTVAVVSVLGRVFMKPVDCPFHALDRVLRAIGDRTRTIVVDVHAEATSDKQLIARHLQGRASAVLGTHTHVPTADATILPPGTAYITDVGMTGPYDSVIGRRVDRVLKTTITFEPTAFDVATGDPRISAALVEIDPGSGHARSIQLIHLNESAIESLGDHVAPQPTTS